MKTLALILTAGALTFAAPAVAAPTDHQAKTTLQHYWHADHVHVWNCRRGPVMTTCRDKTLLYSQTNGGSWTAFWLYSTDRVALQQGRLVVHLGSGIGSVSGS